MKVGWMYLYAVMDWHSPYIIDCSYTRVWVGFVGRP